MPPLLRRFLFFGVGFGLGLVAVSGLFGDRISSCSYFPNERVIDEASNKPWKYDKDFTKKMDIYKLDPLSLREVFMNGEIDFDESMTRQKPCGKYEMKTKKGLKTFQLYFSKCDSSIVFNNISLM